MSYVRVFPLLMLIVTSALFLSCGQGPVGNAQKFEPNRAPVIDSISDDLPEGVDLSNGMTIQLTVRAHDPDGDGVECRFETQYGSFSGQTETADGCEVSVITSNISGGTAAVVRVTVSDGKGLSSSMDYSIGSGELGPGITVSSVETPIPGCTDVISGSSSLKMQFSISSRGGYKIEVRNDLGTVVSGDSTWYYYDIAGTTVEKSVYGPDFAGKTPYYCDGEGSYTVRITAKDLQSQLSTQDIALSVDATPPSVTDSPGGGSFSGGQTVTLSGTDGETECVKISYSVNSGTDPDFSGSGTVIDGTSCSFSVGGAGDGEYIVKFRAMDKVGNIGAVETVSYYIDSNGTVAAPVVSGPGTPTNNRRPTWTWSSGGGGLGIYRYGLDDSNINNATETTAGSFTPSGDLSEGSHRLYVWELDVAGWSTYSFADVVVDISGPSVEAGTDVLCGGAASLSGSAGDASGIASYSWSVDSGPGAVSFNNAAAASTNITAGAEGEYQLRLEATDGAGNSSSDTMKLTVDKTGPSVNAGSDCISNIPVEISGTANDPHGVASYKWTVDSGPGTVNFGSDTSAKTSVSAAIDGEYQLRLTATDVAGNTGSDVVKYTRDTGFPSVSAGADVTTNKVVTLTATAGDLYDIDPATYSWSGPGGVFFDTPKALSTKAAVTTDGTYTVQFTACDRAGNCSSDTMELSYENTPPQVNITSPGNGGMVYNTRTVTAAASDAGTGIAKVQFWIRGAMVHE
ncbi:MAG TPA: Ig-like domain-containing protein, partial [Spirochaetota bacterium]|nr:Ig-like domain-containing protein [Spirochaetota bacterium]